MKRKRKEKERGGPTGCQRVRGLLGAEGVHGVDAGGAAGGDERGDEGDDGEEGGHGEIGERVARAVHIREGVLDALAAEGRDEEREAETEDELHGALAEDHREDRGAVGAERHADAEFGGALVNGEIHDAANAEGEGGDGEGAKVFLFEEDAEADAEVLAEGVGEHGTEERGREKDQGPVGLHGACPGG